jgi:MYXO-CTERM domain-containing protein
VALVVTVAIGLHPQRAAACGGFFCSSAQPVNQAAERIIFSANSDGTVTAVVQIQYSGPSEDFAWVLPVPGVPEVGVSSDLAFARLQQASNPQYILTTQIEGQCRQERSCANCDASADGAGGAGGAGGFEPVVDVLAEGTVGPYDYTVILPNASYANVGLVAVEWLKGEGYDVVPPGGDEDEIAELLGSYLDAGMNLLAFRLSKGNDTGTIRPIRMTYASERPMIPIRPTAVAANDDMGVMVWVLGEHRAVPSNYLSLELNETLIDWTTSASNYNEVVIAAADEAGGQGFVTERAGPNGDYDEVVYSQSDELRWAELQELAAMNDLQTLQYLRAEDLRHPLVALLAGDPDLGSEESQALLEQLRSIIVLTRSAEDFAGWDGYRDLLADLLSGTVEIDELLSCPRCEQERLQPIDVPALLAGLQEQVVAPMREAQTLLESRPYVTRLYTTLSAPEMDVDPVFDFNPDLPAVSNVHNATRVIECSSMFWQSEANSRIELEDGRVVRLQANAPWPFSTDDPSSAPANAAVLELSTRGAGNVVQDNGEAIDRALDAHNATVPPTLRLDSSCSLARGKRSPAPWLGLAVLVLIAGSRRRRHY